MRLAILATHPIQYYAPVFRRLANESGLETKVFYGWQGLTQTGMDHGFGQSFAWDVPLLDGYDHEFINNVASDPGTHHFRGIDCPTAIAELHQWKPDVIAVFGWNYRTHLKVLRHFHGSVPILFRGDSHLLDERSRFKTALRRVWLRWVYRHIDLALTVGTENRRYYLKHGVPESKIGFAPHAIDNDRFADPQWVEQGARRRVELGISREQTVIGFFGKLEPKKAPRLLLDAWSQTDRTDLGVVFVGSGSQLQELKSLNLPRVHFLGFCNQREMPALYHAVDIVALPSRGPGETWGLVVNEAMACGRPAIVSSAVGCAADLITPDTGWVFPRDDEQSLAQVLAELPKRDKLSRMGTYCRRYINDWSIDRQVSGWVAAVEKLCRA